MELNSILPIVVAVVVAFVLFRLVLGAVKMSAKLIVWGLIAVAMLGLGYVWYQHQDPATRTGIPPLNIPGNR